MDLLKNLSLEDQRFGEAILHRAWETAQSEWDGQGAHPPGQDAGDQADLMILIFGRKALGDQVPQED